MQDQSQQLQNAISLAQLSSDPLIKQQAISYIEHLKKSPNSWLLSIQIADFNTNEQVLFFCYQVVEEMLRNKYESLDVNQKLLVRKTVWKWMLDITDQPFYLSKKVIVLVVLVFKHEYPQWSFFQDLFQYLGNGQDLGRVKVFLEICLTIDEEIVSVVVQKTQLENLRNVFIKDTMRDDCVPMLVDTWRQLFIQYKSNGDVAKLCLEITSLYVVWVDINLILKQEFIGALYDCLSVVDLRVSALDCLSAIVLKGMKRTDKLNLIQLLNVVSVLEQIDAQGDEDFEENIAKLVGNVGLELSHTFDDQNALESDKFNALQQLDSLFPLLLRYLKNEYDDTTSALFPFLQHYLLIVKRTSNAIKPNQLESLINVLILKMKYDIEEDYRVGQEAGEDEALFIEMRKTLKTFLDSIGAIDYQMLSKQVCDTVVSVFDKLASDGNVQWVDCELALYLIYIFAESKTNKGAVFVSSSMEPTPMGLMLTKMLDCGISNYPHISIAPMYFEVLIRYYTFFEQNTAYLTPVLQSFLDARGLFNPKKSIRLRVNYLFLRFVKLIRNYLSQYVESVLAVVQELLVIRPRSVSKLEDLPKTVEVDGQIYLFEAVGYLLSLEQIEKKRQGELLTIVMRPALSRIEEIIGYLETNAVDLVLIAELGDLISAIGGVTKGFPDFEVKDINQVQVWTEPFKTTLAGILVVLQKYNRFENIRSSARFALQRMTGCMGPAMLEYIPSFLSSGLFSSESASELVEFLPFIGLTVHKFNLSCRPILISIWLPLREKVHHYLMQPPVGTDDKINLINLRKADLTLLTSLFNSQLDDILCVPENLPMLSPTLTTALASLDDLSDLPTKKLVISLFTKMVYCWGGISPKPKEGSRSRDSDKLIQRPLPGFDSFIFESILPALFNIPTTGDFKVTDGQSILVMGELASFHKTTYEIFDTVYLEYLALKFFPAIQCPTNLAYEFTQSLQSMDKKAFRIYLQGFYSSKR